MDTVIFSLKKKKEKEKNLTNECFDFLILSFLRILTLIQGNHLFLFSYCQSGLAVLDGWSTQPWRLSTQLHPACVRTSGIVPLITKTSSLDLPVIPPSPLQPCLPFNSGWLWLSYQQGERPHEPTQWVSLQPHSVSSQLPIPPTYPRVLCLSASQCPILVWDSLHN